MGAVTAKSIERMAGKNRVARDSEGNVDIRIPSESPSNNWWKITAVNNVAVNELIMGTSGKTSDDALKLAPSVIDNVSPITTECTIMPN